VELSGETSCSLFSLSLSHMTFKYTSATNFTIISSKLRLIKYLFQGAEPQCEFATGLFFCNTIFVPCNLTTGTPRPFCSDACKNLYRACKRTFIAIVDIGAIANLNLMKNCENTLSHLNTGFGYPNTSSDFEDDCLNLPGICICILSTKIASSTSSTYIKIIDA